MKKLSKREEAQRDVLVIDLANAAKSATDIYEKLNRMILEEVKPVIEAYNEALERAREFKEDIVSSMSEYQDARSERWQEGEAGQDFESWKSSWDEFEADPLEDVEEIEAPEIDHSDRLNELPSEPGLG